MGPAMHEIIVRKVFLTVSNRTLCLCDTVALMRIKIRKSQKENNTLFVLRLRIFFSSNNSTCSS